MYIINKTYLIFINIKKINLKIKMDFYFPTEELKLEDYSPVQVIALKEYYKTYFINILETVTNIFF